MKSSTTPTISNSRMDPDVAASLVRYSEPAAEQVTVAYVVHKTAVDNHRGLPGREVAAANPRPIKRASNTLKKASST